MHCRNPFDMAGLTPHQMTPCINQYNVENAQAAIARKKSSAPFYATSETVLGAVTDMDHTPYSRFFRGVAEFSEPVVMEREAGWRTVNNGCYSAGCEGEKSEKDSYPNHCFEAPCSTVYPCYPKYLHKYRDRAALDVQLNRACTMQYR